MPAPHPENASEPPAEGSPAPDSPAPEASASKTPAPETPAAPTEASATPPFPGDPALEFLAGGGAGSTGARSGGQPTEAVRLLVKALAGLPGAERDEVYVWLLGRAMAGPYGSAQAPGRLREVRDQLVALQNAGGPSAAQTGQQLVPVRFSADQHAQLRAWCAEHGFSMATVIRGLVVRFLEGQLPAKD
jgi:hypothetical protein